MDDATPLLTSLLPSLEFPVEIPKHLLCDICKRPALRPWRTKCRHLYCWLCFNDMMKGLHKCLIDNRPVNIGETTLQKDVDDAVRQLQVKCPYENHGCDAIIYLSEIKDHMNACDSIPVFCPKQCGMTISRKDVLRHLASSCDNALTGLPQTLIKSVVAQNPTAIQLNNACRESDGFSELQHQMHQLNAAMNQLAIKVETREKINLSMSSVSDIVNGSSESVCENADQSDSELQPVSVQLNDDEKANGKSLEIEAVLLQKIQKMENKMLTKETVKRTEALILERMDTLRNSLHNHYKKMDSMELSCRKLSETCSTLVKTVEHFEKMLDEDFRTLIELTQTMDKKQKALVKFLGHSVEGPFTMSHECGQFLWKITNYSHKKQQSVDGIEKEVHSPPFFSHPYGYKLCLRVYLNGYNTSENPHLSVYICLMKGPYDDLLSWPFRHKFTISLLDQSDRDKKEHISQAVDPKKVSASFKNWCQKPRTDKNAGFGLPEFISRSKLEEGGIYLRNDSLYVKVVLDDS